MLPPCRQRCKMLWSLKASTGEKIQTDAWRAPPITPPPHTFPPVNSHEVRWQSQGDPCRLVDHWKLTWSDWAPLSTTGNSPTKPSVTDHFPCSFSIWEVFLSPMTTGIRKQKQEYRSDCWEQGQKCFSRLFRYGQPSALVAHLQRAKGQSQTGFAREWWGGESHISNILKDTDLWWL